jgi:diadenylate cyclase
MLSLLSGEFKWLDFIDIVLVAILLYQLYQLVRGTVAINILIGVTLFYALWLLVRAMNMRLFSHILGKFIDVGFIALLIVFQQELRRFFIFIGTTNFISKGSLAKRFLEWNMKGNKVELDTNAVIKAVKNMSETRTGALIVITRASDLKFYANTGDPIDARVSVRMIESIFYKNSPLHDGALLITDNQLRAARCVLPVTEDADFPAHLGMRHRAAVGITENSDALAIAVSEQTGDIALAKEGRLIQGLTPEKLRELLDKYLTD